MALTLALVLSALAGWLDPSPAGWLDPSPVGVLAGQATSMDPGVMAVVATNRGHIADPADYPAWLAEQGVVGAVALNRAGDVGRRVWVTGPAGLEGPFLVLDCAQRRHFQSREERDVILEVDGATAERWAMVDLVDVVVWFADPLPEYPSGLVHAGSQACDRSCTNHPQEIPR